MTTLLCVSVAAASADSLAVTVGTAAPEQAVPVSLQFTGSTARDSDLLAVVRPAGGIPCQPSYGSDQTAAANANHTLFDYGDREESPGSFSEQATYTPQNPGSYLVCAWVEANDGNNTVTAGPISATFSARGPQVSELSVALAGVALPGRGFHINYTTQTDQQLGLDSVVKPAGGLPCASSYELETQQNQDEQTVYEPGDVQVFGGPTTNTATTTEQKAGPYVICTWVEGPNNEEVDATSSTPIYVGRPPQPPACRVPAVHRGASLRAVKRAITAHHCTVGAIKHRYDRHVRRGTVIGLVPLPGTRRAGGAPVTILVSAGAKPRHRARKSHHVVAASAARGAGLGTFAGTWYGHTRELKITRKGAATESMWDGCCDHVLTLHFQLSRVRGSATAATANARVTSVRWYDRADWSGRAPFAGESRTLHLKAGVITEPFTNTVYCDMAADDTGRCGA